MRIAQTRYSIADSSPESAAERNGKTLVVWDEPAATTAPSSSEAPGGAE